MSNFKVNYVVGYIWSDKKGSKWSFNSNQKYCPGAIITKISWGENRIGQTSSCKTADQIVEVIKQKMGLLDKRNKVVLNC